MGIPEHKLVANPADAQKFVARRVTEESDYINIIADVPGPDQASLNALVAAAHAQGKLTIAHASSFYTPCQMAQEAGIDVLTHVPVDKAVGKADVGRMLTNTRIIVPTLTVMKTFVKAVRRPGLDYSSAKETVTALYRAGVPILAGTGANQAPGLPWNDAHRNSLHHELELLVDAGLSTVHVLWRAHFVTCKAFRTQRSWCYRAWIQG
jgi:hypothetical protein